MQDSGSVEFNDGKIDVILHGGPTYFPENLRVQRIEVGQRKVKIMYAGGYEHFERVDDEDNEAPVNLWWTMCTKIAE